MTISEKDFAELRDLLAKTMAAHSVAVAENTKLRKLLDPVNIGTLADMLDARRENVHDTLAAIHAAIHRAKEYEEIRAKLISTTKELEEMRAVCNIWEMSFDNERYNFNGVVEEMLYFKNAAAEMRSERDIAVNDNIKTRQALEKIRHILPNYSLYIGNDLINPKILIEEILS